MFGPGLASSAATTGRYNKGGAAWPQRGQRLRMDEPLSQAEYEALANFRYELRRFLRFSEEAARAAGVEPQQHQALLAVRGFPQGQQVTIGDLAERLQIRHHSMVGLVGRLVGLGLLERAPGRADRRQVLLKLTPRGEALLDTLTAAHRAELRRLGPQLTALLKLFVGPEPPL